MKNNKRFIILFGVLVVFALFSFLLSAVNGEGGDDQVKEKLEPTIAIVSTVNGTCKILEKNTNKEKPAELGMELRDGDKIIIGKDSKITILYMNGSVESINKESIYTLNLEQIEKRSKTRSELPETVSNFDEVFSEEEREITLATAVSLRPIEDFWMISPKNNLFSTRPKFTWQVSKEIKETNFIVYLEAISGEELFKVEVNGKFEIKFPKDVKELQRGKMYKWRVELASGDDYSDDQAFTVLDEAQAKNISNDIETIKREYKDESIFLILAGLTYKENSLYSEAIGFYSKLSTLHPEQKYPHQELAILYQTLYLVELYNNEMNIIEELKGE